MEDIEDIVNSGLPEERLEHSTVIIRQIKKKPKLIKPDPLIPGTQTIYTKTYGCSHNISDGEYMMGQLSSYGYEFTDNKEKADIWLINSCTVKNPSEASFMHLVNDAKKRNKPIVVSGCVPQGQRNLKGLENVSIVGISQINRVVEVVEETLRGNVVRLLGKKRISGETLPLNLPKIRKNKNVEIVPINGGCLGSCTYCKTKHARGKLSSYAISTIVERIDNVIQEGIREIWLTSEDTGAYGLDIGTNIVELMDNILSIPYFETHDDVMVRLGMTNPPYIKDHIEGISRILCHKNVYSFLHIPVQSGNDKVLVDMNREYTVADFHYVVDHLLANVPNITIATDVICGFPYETDDEFEDTIDLVNKYRFPILNISQFYPRTGTVAAKMEQLDRTIVKKRSKAVSELFKTYKTFDRLLGKRVKVWFDTEMANDGKYRVAHTKEFIKVLVDTDSIRLTMMEELYNWMIDWLCYFVFIIFSIFGMYRFTPIFCKYSKEKNVSYVTITETSKFHIIGKC